jgi:hypothetical protein
MSCLCTNFHPSDSCTAKKSLATNCTHCWYNLGALHNLASFNTSIALSGVSCTATAASHLLLSHGTRYLWDMARSWRQCWSITSSISRDSVTILNIYLAFARLLFTKNSKIVSNSYTRRSLNQEYSMVETNYY